MYVLTIVSSNSDVKLWRHITRQLQQLMIKYNCCSLDFKWLAQNRAADFKLNFSSAYFQSALAQLCEVQRWPVDYLLQPIANRRKRLLVADMEATIIGQEMLNEMGRAVDKERQIVDITRRAMTGELEFSESLAQRSALFAGHSEFMLAKLTEHISLNPGALTMVKTLSTHGVYCALVTGGFEIFARYVQKICGFSACFANQLEIIEHQISGRLSGLVIDAEGKKTTTKALMSQLQLRPSQVCAVGDGANDYQMLQLAGLGVGYYAKTVLNPVVELQIRHTDFETLLFVQGYTESVFVYA